MSKGSTRVLKALRVFVSGPILEEYNVGERLRLDFYIKHLKFGVECDGIQHDVFNGFFFDNADAFKAAQQRDRRKEQLCEEQGITLVRLKYDEVMSAKSAERLAGLILERAKKARPEAGTEEDW